MQRLKLSSVILLLIAGWLILFMNRSTDAATPALRISTWYWLNSIEKTGWEKDFNAVAQAGFTDIVLCWGLDSAAVLSQRENTREALELCRKYHLKAYLFVWHPTHNSLPRKPVYQQVDSRGNLLFTFNIFHREWRATQWKSYLQDVAAAYKDQPAFAGYLFDDTFAIGPIGSFGGDDGDKRGDFVSYSDYDLKNYRQWLQEKYREIGALNRAWQQDYQDFQKIEPPRELSADKELQWQDWTAARRQWLREWADETVKYLREIDSNREHEIYVEDTSYALGIETSRSKQSYREITIKDSFGLDFGYCLQPFDAVCGYNFLSWDKPDALTKAAASTAENLRVTRAQLGEQKKIIYTFWASDFNFGNPEPIKFPTAEQIITVAEQAIGQGIRHIDYYGFRIGDWRVDETEWLKLRPGSDINYPVTKPMKRFLCDRAEVLKVMATRHQELKKKLEER